MHKLLGKENLNFGKTIQLILLFFYQTSEQKRKIYMFYINKPQQSVLEVWKTAEGKNKGSKLYF